MTDFFNVTSEDGTEIGCRVRGSGPPLLLIHGTGDTHQGFERLAGYLDARFTLYLMDRRGRGLSGDGPSYSIDREGEDIATVLDAIGPGAFLFAHSYSATCTFHALPRLRSVGSIMLYEPPMAPAHDEKRKRAVDRLAELADEDDRDGIIVTHLKDFVGVPQRVIDRQRENQTGWQARLKMAHTIPRELLVIRHFQIPPQQPSVPAPLSVLCGDETRAPLKGISRSVHEALPGSDFTLIPGEEHFAQRTAPDVLATLVTNWFQTPA